MTIQILNDQIERNTPTNVQPLNVQTERSHSYTFKC